MSVSGLKQLVDEQADVLPFTVAQYHHMLRAGILQDGDPYELLGGYLIRKDRGAREGDALTIGNHHAWAVKRLAKLGRSFERHGCHLQTRQPVTLSDLDEPEPDAAVILGAEDDFRERHPGPADVACVIEVSDHSLARDRTTKLRVYASAGIGCYVIVNLAESVVEVYTNPSADQGRYADSATLAPGRALDLPAGRGKRVSVPVRSLLP